MLMKNNQVTYSDFEHQLMKDLIEKASFYRGKTRPNPVVAAAVYRNNNVISIGVHQKAGLDHAEVIAIRKAAGNLNDVSLMVTLEPCTHYGKTPPCVQAIIDAGISDVVYAIKDPNPLMKNRSAYDIFTEAGISVRIGLCKELAYQLNRSYFYYHNNKKPYVILKAATSLDGKVALSTGESKYITSEESLKKVHHLRSCVDAITLVKIQ